MAKEEKLINCLTNEKVIVRFVPRENAMIGNNPKHVLYGGMAETSTRTYVVPQLRSGQLVDVLTKSEKAFLESYLGLEDDALSVYRTENNFWKKFKVILNKEDNVLDLSQGMDYIKYKVLLANKNLIAPNMQTLMDYPKATYEFVLIKESENESTAKMRIDSKKEAYKVWGKIDTDVDTMRVIVESLTRRPTSSSIGAEGLNKKIEELIDHDAKTFLKVAQDEYLPTKVLIRNAIEAGVINNRGGQLFMRDTNEPLCENGEPTMSVASAYLNMPKHNELKLLIEAKVEQYKKNL